MAEKADRHVLYQHSVLPTYEARPRQEQRKFLGQSLLAFLFSWNVATLVQIMPKGHLKLCLYASLRLGPSLHEAVPDSADLLGWVFVADVNRHPIV